MQRITNVSAYRFACLSDLRGLRQRLLPFCKARDLKGTVLLAQEGINLFVAGHHQAIEELVAEIRLIPGLAELRPKYSESDEQPFTRMLVRLKKEIIAFGVGGIDPARHTSPRIRPEELRQWIEEGRDFVLLDTRNDYEVKLGSFENALPVGIRHFRDFPAAVATLPGELRDKPVVTFCTGGIRCEKAAPLMERLGFREVYQLDGGILKYFEEVGGDHYRGECFVFDHRVGLDPALRESGSVVCFACQAPLTAEEAEDPRHVPGESCPYCYQPDEERHRRRLAMLQAKLDRLADPLPGSVPADNRKPVRIPGSRDGMTLLAALESMFPHAPQGEWRAMIEDGRLRGTDSEPVGAGRRVRAGEEYVRVIAREIEPEVNGRLRLLDEDEAWIVLDKPAPLPMHPCGRFRRNTLEHFLREAWAPAVPRPVHRLDANTSGVVVCARTRAIARRLQPQFAGGGAGKEYLARVAGHPAQDRYVIDLPIGTRPGEAGSRDVDPQGGRPARSEVEVLDRLDDGTALLKVWPLTGRTNQIRVHLWRTGHPIVGDPGYRPGGEIGRSLTLKPGDPPMCLHAWRLRLRHPLDGREVEFEAPAPEWARVGELGVRLQPDSNRRPTSLPVVAGRDGHGSTA